MMKKFLPVYRAFLIRIIFAELDHTTLDIESINAKTNYQDSLYQELLGVETLDELDSFVSQSAIGLTLPELHAMVENYYKN